MWQIRIFQVGAVIHRPVKCEIGTIEFAIIFSIDWCAARVIWCRAMKYQKRSILIETLLMSPDKAGRPPG